METEYFFGMVNQYETSRIQGYRGDIHSSAISKVPRSFGFLLQNIIKEFEANLDFFCSAEQKVIIIGFQPLAVNYHSDTPKKLNRVYSKLEPSAHFCCTLEYIVVPKNQRATGGWQKTLSILVDFTTGEIMDRSYFIDRFDGNSLDKANNKGLSIGVIQDELLKIAWQTYFVRERLQL